MQRPRSYSSPVSATLNDEHTSAAWTLMYIAKYITLARQDMAKCDELCQEICECVQKLFNTPSSLRASRNYVNMELEYLQLKEGAERTREQLLEAEVELEKYITLLFGEYEWPEREEEEEMDDMEDDEDVVMSDGSEYEPDQSDDDEADD
jgi:hypothetical protein